MFFESRFPLLLGDWFFIQTLQEQCREPAVFDLAGFKRRAFMIERKSVNVKMLQQRFAVVLQRFVIPGKMDRDPAGEFLPVDQVPAEVPAAAPGEVERLPDGVVNDPYWRRRV